MEKTELKYLNDSYQFEDDDKVLEINTDPDGRKYIILNGTIFYAQGGGQPYDIGKITKDNNEFEVAEVRFKDGYIYHYGHNIKGELNIGDTVHLHIDENRRKLHCRLHSGGHLIDIALKKLGYNLVPVKGYHFPDGPYVEYQGIIPGDLNLIAKQIEDKISVLIKHGYEIHTEILEKKEDLATKCLFVPDYIPEGKPVRVVYVWGNVGIPCGGTHVKNIDEINHISIPKIKVTKGNTRISYKTDQ